MSAREDVAELCGVGVCASSGYMAQAVADDDRLSKLALVAPWIHDQAMAEQVYEGHEAAMSMIAASEAHGDKVLTAASTSDHSAPMYNAPYYTEKERGLIPSYDNKFAVATWKPWLTYDGQASADRLTKPTLMVGSPAIALPAGAQAFEARTKAPVQKLWLGEDVSQFDFYEREDAVSAATDAVAKFFKG